MRKHNFKMMYKKEFDGGMGMKVNNICNELFRVCRSGFLLLVKVLISLCIPRMLGNPKRYKILLQKIPTGLQYHVSV